MGSPRPEISESAPPASGRVIRLPLLTSDAEIVAALRAGHDSGGAALYDRYHRHVRRVLVRLLGPGAEISDLVQDVFVAAIDSIERLQHVEALKSWVASIAVFRARAEIRRRSRSRWFPLFANDDLPEAVAAVPSPEVDAAVRATYRVLDKLPTDERIAFSLRVIEGMELTEVARACRVSLATIKRRISRAQRRFVSVASTYPELSEWLEGGRP